MSAAVLAPVDEVTLRGLVVAPHFQCYFGGDAERIAWMLGEVATTKGGRLSVAVGRGAEIGGHRRPSAAGAAPGRRGPGGGGG
jgi:hypothetical protein